MYLYIMHCMWLWYNVAVAIAIYSILCLLWKSCNIHQNHELSFILFNEGLLAIHWTYYSKHAFANTLNIIVSIFSTHAHTWHIYTKTKHSTKVKKIMKTRKKWHVCLCILYMKYELWNCTQQKICTKKMKIWFRLRQEW